MWLVGRYGGRNHVCNISWLSVKGWGCGEKGKFAFSHWLHASPLQHWSHYRVTVWFEPNLAQNINTTLSARRNGQNHINWKSMKAAAAILNFGKISITPDLMQISAANYMGRCIMATWQKLIFLKFKMADGFHLRNRLIDIPQQSIVRFLQIFAIWSRIACQKRSCGINCKFRESKWQTAAILKSLKRHISIKKCPILIK